VRVMRPLQLLGPAQTNSGILSEDLVEADEQVHLLDGVVPTTARIDMLWVASVDMPHFDAGISKWGMTPMCRTACPRPGMNGATP
jgi:hypothetical protein